MIFQLNSDAENAHKFLKDFVNTLAKNRKDCIKQDNFVAAGEVKIEDTWPPLAIGWASKDSLPMKLHALFETEPMLELLLTRDNPP